MRTKSMPKRHTTKSSTEVELLRKELKAERKARIAAEKKVEQLESRIKAMAEEMKQLRRQRIATEEMLQNEIRRLEKEVADRDRLLEQVNEQLVWFRENFMKDNRSEKDGAGEEQQEETASDEKSANGENKEEEPTEKRKRGQQKGKKGPGRSDRSQLREETEILSKTGCACKICGKAYRCLDVSKPSPLIELYKELVRIKYEREVYVPDCKCAGNEKEVITADPPLKLFDRTEIGNTLWVYFLAEKYLYGTPTNRVLKELSLLGLPLSPGTVTGGFQIIDDKVTALYEGIINHCRGADFWNGDETWWRLFGKRWWLWQVSSPDAVVYLLDPSRSKKVPKNFFAGSVGILMTDRLACYKGLHAGIRKAWCWVHQRRDFLNVFKGIPKLRDWAKNWLTEIGRLFVLNHCRFKLWEQGKTAGSDWTKASEELEQHVQHLESLWQEELKNPSLHKKQKKILESMKRHWEGLTIFLSEPRVPLHNNRAELLLRNPVVLRKNSYGSGSQWL